MAKISCGARNLSPRRLLCCLGLFTIFLDSQTVEMRDSLTCPFVKITLQKTGQIRLSPFFDILWPVTSNAYHKEALQCAATGGSPNNISPIIKYAVTDGAEFIWMGDLETDFQEKIQDAIKLPSVDIEVAP